MKNKWWLTGICLLLTTTIWAQRQGTIQGTVVDSLAGPLIGASVVLLHEQDSILAQFAVTDGEGRFSLDHIREGAFILQVTYVGYKTFSQAITYQPEQGNRDVGTIRMEAVSALLDEVTVEADRIPMSIRNDTIVYDADAFNTRANAAVEDLLKRLPGIEVDRNGQIKAQGKDVDRVMVDGKEFFGDDPTIATQNLPADAVDKVEVFDKKSEAAEFSGIDDGRRETTINLALKEDKKQGYFGKVSAGYGTDNRYEGRGNINRFSPNMQLSAIGMANNTNQQGFSLNDYINFMGGLRNMMGGGGGSVRIELDDAGGIPLGMGQNNGIANTSAGGINFNYDLGERTELSSNYFLNSIRNNRNRSSVRDNFIGSDIFRTEEENSQIDQSLNHRLNTRVKHEIDSSQNLIFRANMGWNDALFSNALESRAYNAEGTLENTGVSLNDADGQRINAQGDLIYRKRFGKKGRTFSAELSGGFEDDSRKAQLDALNTFFQPQQISDQTLQRQEQESDQWMYSGRVSYTEPLWKRTFLELNYQHQNYTEKLDKRFYDLPVNGSQEEILNTDLTRQFDRDYLYDRVGMNLRFNQKKWNLTTGLSAQQSRLTGLLSGESNPLDRTFLNWLPRMDFRYEFAATKSMELRYRTNVREPSLEQLQPIVDNSNPLQVYSGNPDLRPEYAHRLDWSLMLFDQFSLTNVFANLSTTYTTDRIVNTRSIDSLLRQSIRPVNVIDDLQMDGYFSFGTPLRFIKTRVNLNANLLYSRSRIIVNGKEDLANRWVPALDLRLENRKKDILDIAIGSRWEWNFTRFDQMDQLDQQFRQQTYYADLRVDVKSWSFESSLDYQLYEGGGVALQQAVPIWKASVSKLFLENQRGQLRLSVFDLLNQNLGIQRNSQWNYVEEERIETIGRYVMLSFAYSLSGFGKEEGGFSIDVGR